MGPEFEHPSIDAGVTARRWQFSLRSLLIGMALVGLYCALVFSPRALDTDPVVLSVLDGTEWQNIIGCVGPFGLLMTPCAVIWLIVMLFKSPRSCYSAWLLLAFFATGIVSVVSDGAWHNPASFVDRFALATVGICCELTLRKRWAEHWGLALVAAMITASSGVNWMWLLSLAAC